MTPLKSNVKLPKDVLGKFPRQVKEEEDRGLLTMGSDLRTTLVKDIGTRGRITTPDD